CSATCLKTLPSYSSKLPKLASQRRDISPRLGGATSDLRNLVFEAMRDIDTHPVLRPRYRVLDRLAIAFDQTGHANPSLTLLAIHLELDRRNDRIKDFLESREVDGKHCRHRIRILARHDFEQRVALLVIGAFVEEGLPLATALMHGARPMVDPAHAKIIELH